MKTCIVNTLNRDGFMAIITMLDYEATISRCLKSLELSSYLGNKILIDTALCSGLNEYRFIETTLDNQGVVDLENYKYINVSSEVLKTANEIIKTEPLSLDNSILTRSQKRALLNGTY